MFKIFKIVKLSRFIVSRTTLCFVDRPSMYNLANKSNVVHNFPLCVYFLVLLSISVHVSSNYVPIIRIYNCIYATLGACYSVWMTVWYAGWNPPSIPDSHVEIDRYTTKKLSTKLALFTRQGQFSSSSS